ncbi:hypothetical protein QCA50_014305 [Cerrena zonata]|uniref:F-box domain-containing protein n=1 Tax=Cerrena zonata TaxID=2478898 RepID=A0AAW0FUI5_9APHY
MSELMQDSDKQNAILHPFLNTDVLIYIMRFLTQKGHLLQMMKTCRSLYYSGLPLLLFSITDVAFLKDSNEAPTRMISFSQFIMADPKIRGPMVRDLKVLVSQYPERYFGVLRTFAKVLAELKNLEYLQIFGLERWLKLEKGLMPTLAALPKIKTIRFKPGDNGVDTADRTVQTLKAMHSPVRVLHLELAYTARHQSLFKTLQNFSSTLEFLIVTIAILEKVDVIYPQLKALDIKYLKPDMIRIAPLVACAPNLENLSLGDLVGFCLELDPLRAHNVQTQRTHTWSRLDTLTGGIISLYLSGIQCPVRHLSAYDSLQNESTISMWQTVVQDTLPSALTINLCKLEVEDLPTLIPERAKANLTHLKLSLGVNVFNDSTGVDGIQNNLLALLRPLPLTFLDFGISWYHDDPDFAECWGFGNEDEDREQSDDKNEADREKSEPEDGSEDAYSYELARKRDLGPMGSHISALLERLDDLVQHIAEAATTLRTVVFRVRVEREDDCFVFDVYSKDAKICVSRSQRYYATVSKEEGMSDLAWDEG